MTRERRWKGLGRHPRGYHCRACPARGLFQILVIIYLTSHKEKPRGEREAPLSPDCLCDAQEAMLSDKGSGGVKPESHQTDHSWDVAASGF